MRNEALKAEAKRLRSAIVAMFNVPVTHGQSLELVAKAKNFPNWDAASAAAPTSGGEAPAPSSCAPRAVQHQQLMALRAGLASGLTVASSIDLLKQQDDAALGAYWARVKLDGPIELASMLRETSLFDPGVILMVDMGRHEADLANALSSAITYLREQAELLWELAPA